MNQPRRFADGTKVPVEKTKMELDALLAKHGAQQRSIAQDDVQNRAVVMFKMAGRMARLELRVPLHELPNPLKPDYQQKEKCPQGWSGWTRQRREAWVKDKAAQRERESWRRLLLLVKAKLEIVAEGASSFEREFLCDILLPDGQTVHEALAPQLVAAYETGDMPPLLPPAGGGQ